MPFAHFHDAAISDITPGNGFSYVSQRGNGNYMKTSAARVIATDAAHVYRHDTTSARYQTTF